MTKTDILKIIEQCSDIFTKAEASVAYREACEYVTGYEDNGSISMILADDLRTLCMQFKFHAFNRENLIDFSLDGFIRGILQNYAKTDVFHAQGVTDDVLWEMYSKYGVLSKDEHLFLAVVNSRIAKALFQNMSDEKTGTYWRRRRRHE